jgi:hypothetical protein
VEDQKRFIQERVYLKSVTPATVQWYRNAFRALDDALENIQSIKQRIGELRNRGLSPVSVNVHLLLAFKKRALKALRPIASEVIIADAQKLSSFPINVVEEIQNAPAVVKGLNSKQLPITVI